MEGITKGPASEVNINTAEYWNEKYKTRGGGELQFARRIHGLLKFLKEEKDSILPCSVVDLGCAFGHLCGYFYELGCRPVWGMDISSKGIALAKRNYPQVNFEAYDVSKKLPFKDGTFTLVTSTDTMEHIPSYQDVIKEAFRVLKPGGRFIFTVPNEDLCNEHTWIYTIEGLKKLVHSFGDKGGVSIIKDDKQLDKWSLCWLDKK